MYEQLNSDIEDLEAVAAQLESGQFGGALAEPLRSVASHLKALAPAPAEAATETTAADDTADQGAAAAQGVGVPRRTNAPLGRR